MYKADEKEFCAACKQSVNLYSTISEEFIAKRNKERLGHNTGEDSKLVIESVCQHDHFKKFQPSMKNGCSKLMKDHESKFTQFYTQSVLNPKQKTQKAELFNFIKTVQYKPRCVTKLHI